MMKKGKQRLPTVDEFLQYIPQRMDYPWCTTAEGVVQITVPKFTSNIGNKLCKLMKKDSTFTANLDRLGSFVWQHCDGKTKVQTLLELVKKEFPDEQNIDQRLFLFIQQMGSLNYLCY